MNDSSPNIQKFIHPLFAHSFPTQVTLPSYANYCDLKPASLAPTAPSSPTRRSAGAASPGGGWLDSQGP